jgi:hypothetical protein
MHDRRAGYGRGCDEQKRGDSVLSDHVRLLLVIRERTE